MMVMVTHASRELLRKPSRPETMTASQQRQNIVTEQRAKERKGEAEQGADQRAKQPFARGGNGGADIGLQHNNRADGTPIAVVQAEAQWPATSKCRGQRRLCSMNEKAPPFPREEGGVLRPQRAA